MITLEKFEGHIVLYCKGYYQLPNVTFIDGLRRIWAVRCGLNVEHITSNFDQYIANFMYDIIIKVKPTKIQYLWQIIHQEIANDWKFDKEVSGIQRLIHIYENELMTLKVKERENMKGNFKTLIKLPKPQKRLFKRIVAGKGKFGDYNLVK